eukprot:2773382-Rhodomonas_salina.1
MGHATAHFRLGQLHLVCANGITQPERIATSASLITCPDIAKEVQHIPKPVWLPHGSHVQAQTTFVLLGVIMICNMEPGNASALTP